MSEKRRAATGWLGSHSLLVAMLLLATLSALSGCGSGQTDTAQTANSVPVNLNISMPQESAAASTRGSRFWATVYSWLPSLSNAWAVIYDLSELTVTVTDSDQQLLTTSTNHFSQPPKSGDRITFDLDVPAGSDRIFAVSGIDSRSRRPILQGKRNHVTLIAGKAVTVDITLEDISTPTAPTANAGPDQGRKLPGALITLNGSGSSDPNGDPLTYSWSFTTKPAGSLAVLTNPTNVSPTFTVDRDGSYVVQLIVNDGTVNSLPNTVTITSDNVAPVANAGPDQGRQLPGALITLNGSGSSDANGDPLTYSWSLTTKPAGSLAVLTNPTNVSPTFTVDRDGSYVVQLIVNDGTVNSLPNTVTITSDNVAPVANAGPDQGRQLPGALITLNGSGSSDANGDPLTYSWSLTTKPAGSLAVLTNPTNVSPTFTVDRDGSYVVQLIVNDGTVNSPPKTVTITSDNVAPVANAGPDQGRQLPGALITLNGSGSSDANGDPLTYSWSLTTKPAGSLAVLTNPTNVSPTFTVDRDGSYVVQLIVNDGTVNSPPKTVTITSDNVAPVANAGPDQGRQLPGALITLNGSGSSDANGDPLTYSWSLTTKPAGSLAVLTNPTNVSPTFTVDRDGSYVVQLIVNDGTVNSPPKTVTVTVNPPPLEISTANPLPNGCWGRDYSTRLSASGGTPPYIWSIDGVNSIPFPGLSLSSDGQITGTVHFFEFDRVTNTYRVQDANRESASKRLTIQILCPPPPPPPPVLEVDK